MAVILKISFVVLIGFILMMLLKAGKKYKDFIEHYKKAVGLPFMAPYSFEFLDTFSLIEKFYKQIANIQQKMISLYGTKDATNQTRAFLAQIISLTTLAVLATLLIGIMQPNDTSGAIAMGILTLLIPFVLVKNLDTKERNRRMAIIHELPEFLNKLILLINAGETAQKAFIRCTLAKADFVDKSPLYYELAETVTKIENNLPFSEALNQLSKKCAIQEMSVFTTTLLLNYRKGGEQLVHSLKELSTTLWGKRKAQTQMKGEEASSKMVFPLIMIFGVVMVIVGYPALAMF
ncbi:type II secretion system F family protein [Carnobacterium gallinarum]|uniref:type II secretion system F family protein n=1 Tax=Carnobacterium gallinarum TaxID=2749 RepID=UPI000689E249|nr:type II secretion system F family protein [Carnobacterium gallinarum]